MPKKSKKKKKVKRIHAFGRDVLSKRDATELSQLIASGKISSREAVQAAISRADKINPHLNAIATKTFDAALFAAEKPKSPLHRVTTR